MHACMHAYVCLHVLGISCAIVAEHSQMPLQDIEAKTLKHGPVGFLGCGKKTSMRQHAGTWLAHMPESAWHARVAGQRVFKGAHRRSGERQHGLTIHEHFDRRLAAREEAEGDLVEARRHTHDVCLVTLPYA
jgi:hypothetical protein